MPRPDLSRAPLSPHIVYENLSVRPGNAYVSALLPSDYPARDVIVCAQRHVNLPPNLRELYRRGRQYQERITGQPVFPGQRTELYDYTGEYPVEIDLETGQPADWPALPELALYPDYAGPLPDPMTWEAPPEPEEADDDTDNDPSYGCLSSPEAFLRYMGIVGRAEAISRYSRTPLDAPRWGGLSDREVAETVLREFRD